MVTVWVAVLLGFLTWPRRRRRDVAPLTDHPEPEDARRASSPRRAEDAPDGAATADAMLLVATGLRSPLPLPSVLERVADESPPAVARDLRRVATALRWGVDDDTAWARVGPQWAPLASALEISHRAGIPASRTLYSAARRLRQHEVDAVSEQVAAVGVRLVLPLGTLFLPAFVIMAVVPLLVALGRQLVG